MRVMLIHSHDEVLDTTAEVVTAHCFGPFDTYEDAVAWNNDSEDTCHKLILPIVGPGEYDMALSMAEELRNRDMPPSEHDHRTRLD